MPTDRHTDTHFASLQAGARFFSLQKFIPFHFTTFICLLHSICKGYTKNKEKRGQEWTIKKRHQHNENEKLNRPLENKKNKRPATKLVIQRKLGPLTTCFRIFGHHHHHRHRRLGIQNKIRRSKVCYCQCDQIKYQLKKWSQQVLF